MYSALVERDETLPLAILKDPTFGRPAHIQYVAALPIENLNDAIVAFVRQINADADYVWNGDVVFLLSRSEDPEIQKLVRSKFDDHALRGALLLSISEMPQATDRALFVAALENSPEEILATCIECLLQLPPNQDADEQIALARTLRNLGDARRERKLRNAVMERLAANNGVNIEDAGAEAGENAPSAAQRWVAYVEEKYPAQFAIQSGHSIDAERLAAMLQQTDWGTGDAGRGRKLFETRQCGQCHSGRGAVGPDLNGVAQRFSRDDLFTAIVNPSRDVSPRYQTTALTTTDGKSYIGLVIYESVDYLVLRNASNQTSRIEKKNVEEQRVLSKSLMPDGLLKDMGPGELADLYAYLRAMGVPQTAGATGEVMK